MLFAQSTAEVTELVDDFLSLIDDPVDVGEYELVSLMAPLNDGERIVAMQILRDRGVPAATVENAYATLQEDTYVDGNQVPAPPVPGPVPLPPAPAARRTSGWSVVLGIATFAIAGGVGAWIGGRLARSGRR